MRKTLILVVLSLVLVPGIFARDFSLSWERDLPVALAGAAVFTVSQVMIHNDPNPGPMPDEQDIFAPDRALMRAYNRSVARVSDVLELGCVGLPLLYAIDFDAERLSTAGVMYAETILLSVGLKDLGKALTSRYRPYNYFDGAPEDEGNDDWHSFPSGHATVSFAGSAFASTLFHVWYGDSEWKWPVTIGAASLAAVTGVLRIACGKHFLTDVLAGAALGTACGILVPLLHLDEDAAGDGDRLATPVTVSFVIRK